MKRFQNLTNQQKISDAILIAENLLSFKSNMMTEIKLKNDFKYGSGTGENVFQELYKDHPIVNIYTYRSFNPWSAAIGYSDGKAIYTNVRKLPSMSVVDVVGNILHEYAHYCGFSHGNNYKTEEKCLYSVPYYLSENIEKWI
jgi:hypothetical protein